MIKGILFDKDGTILEYHSTMHYIYGNFFSDLEKIYSVPEPLILKLKSILGYLPYQLSSDSLIQFAANHQIVDVLIQSSKDYSEKYQWQLNYDNHVLLEIIEDNSLRESVPYSTLTGVEETLDYLKNKNYELGIATADSHAATIAGLKKTDILHYFKYIGTSEKNTKPKPETFLADVFCSRFNIEPDELLIVGDSKTDMIFAKNVGAHFIGIHSSYNDNTVFQSMGYQSISKINEIIEIFDL